MAYVGGNPISLTDPEGLFPGGSGLDSPGMEEPLMCAAGPDKCKICTKIKGVARIACLLWCLAEGRRPPPEPPPAPRPPAPFPAPGP